MADSWLLWCGVAVAAAFALLLSLAGYALVGLLFGAAIWLAARAAVKPAARGRVDDALLGACDRLPFCDCRPKARRR